MNRERELLKKCAEQLNSKLNGTTSMRLAVEIEELLAQPGQKPVAWMYDWDDEHGRTYVNLLTTDTEHTYLKTAFNVMPLYTHPPKQYPLDDREISHGFRISKKAIHAESFWVGVKFAEKAHGIGVDE